MEEETQRQGGFDPVPGGRVPLRGAASYEAEG